jgi:hypothetical protein
VLCVRETGKPHNGYNRMGWYAASCIGGTRRLARYVSFEAIRRGEFMLFRSRTGAIILIIVGTLFLVSNLGWIPQLGPFFRQWWPLILIIIGVLMLVQRL